MSATAKSIIFIRNEFENCQEKKKSPCQDDIIFDGMSPLLNVDIRLCYLIVKSSLSCRFCRN